MAMPLRLCVLSMTAALVFGCGRDAQPVSPSVVSSAIERGDSEASDERGSIARAAAAIEHAVTLFDACDPQTFNAALGAGTCTRAGGVTFQNFLEELGRHHSVGAWHFAPRQVTMQVGQTLVAVNRGGETHTFTEVEDFGGGIVPALNNLAGLPTVAPECNQLAPGDFLAPGAKSTDTEEESGVEKYQCCIHPWMQAEVRIAEKNR
jgi:plastocyanin